MNSDKINNIKKYVGIVGVSVLVFGILINYNLSFYRFMKQIPVIDILANGMKFTTVGKDKGKGVPFTYKDDAIHYNIVRITPEYELETTVNDFDGHNIKELRYVPVRNHNDYWVMYGYTNEDAKDTSIKDIIYETKHKMMKPVNEKYLSGDHFVAQNDDFRDILWQYKISDLHFNADGVYYEDEVAYFPVQLTEGREENQRRFNAVLSNASNGYEWYMYPPYETTSDLSLQRIYFDGTNIRLLYPYEPQMIQDPKKGCIMSRLINDYAELSEQCILWDELKTPWVSLDSNDAMVVGVQAKNTRDIIGTNLETLSDGDDFTYQHIIQIRTVDGRARTYSVRQTNESPLEYTLFDHKLIVTTQTKHDIVVIDTQTDKVNSYDSLAKLQDVFDSEGIKSMLVNVAYREVYDATVHQPFGRTIVSDAQQVHGNREYDDKGTLQKETILFFSKMSDIRLIHGSFSNDKWTEVTVMFER
ncbi:hypothetical protein G7062_04580 [Erysipelothrix sp. HDW6C]|uniref:hypothetical protein n=1 Tax=Erysipelothrix sp. HDW6C TaxID=2714930 RepID=UPI00140E1C01|nr:hypothetical protein [Erysipelothrix sp. HDW6C]QIK69616.1 hypothetical protein G7062_04580 [Erysipelothrix sp. HDW6C]